MKTDRLIETINHQTGITELSTLGLIQIAGTDAEKFLQGQLTCDLHDITETQSRLAAHCNHQGRVVSSFRIYKIDANYYLSLPATMITIATEHLKKYAVFSKVTLTDVSTHFKQLGIIGEDNLLLLQTMFKDLPQQNDAAFVQNDLIIIRVPGTPLRYQLIVPAGSIPAIQKALTISKWVDARVWHQHDVLAGICMIYPETSGLFTPHALNHLKFNAVSFNKGCYIGQEIIARTQYRGQSQRQLLLGIINCARTPSRGAPIIDSAHNEIGKIADVAAVSDNRYIILLICHKTANTEFYWENFAIVPHTL